MFLAVILAAVTHGFNGHGGFADRQRAGIVDYIVVGVERQCINVSILFVAIGNIDISGNNLVLVNIRIRLLAGQGQGGQAVTGAQPGNGDIVIITVGICSFRSLLAAVVGILLVYCGYGQGGFGHLKCAQIFGNSIVTGVHAAPINSICIRRSSDIGAAAGRGNTHSICFGRDQPCHRCSVVRQRSSVICFMIAAGCNGQCKGFDFKLSITNI